MSNYKTVFFTLEFSNNSWNFYVDSNNSSVYLFRNRLIFFWSSIITIIFGTLFFLSNLDHDKKLNLQQAFLLTALILVKYCNFWFFTFYFF